VPADAAAFLFRMNSPKHTTNTITNIIGTAIAAASAPLDRLDFPPAGGVGVGVEVKEDVGDVEDEDTGVVADPVLFVEEEPAGGAETETTSSRIVRLNCVVVTPPSARVTGAVNVDITKDPSPQNVSSSCVQRVWALASFPFAAIQFSYCWVQI